MGYLFTFLGRKEKKRRGKRGLSRGRGGGVCVRVTWGLEKKGERGKRRGQLFLSTPLWQKGGKKKKEKKGEGRSRELGQI